MTLPTNVFTSGSSSFCRHPIDVEASYAENGTATKRSA